MIFMPFESQYSTCY